MPCGHDCNDQENRCDEWVAGEACSCGDDDCGEFEPAHCAHYCEDDCADESEWDGLSYDPDRPGHCTPNRPILSYTYKPIPLFRGKGPLYFGVELEVEAPYNADREDLARPLVADGFYCKLDGSLNHGFEIVSHPASIDWWRNAKLGDHFERLRKARCTSYQNETCGMHIHFSRGAVSQFTLLKMLHLFEHYPEFILKTSRRPASRFYHYASLESEGDRFLIRKAQGVAEGTRGALNFQNYKTIECRIFRGTLYEPSFRRNLEWLYAVIRFAESHSLQEMNPDKFRDWIASANGMEILGRDAVRMLLPWVAECIGARTTELQEV
jgi:hypothetical protein